MAVNVEFAVEIAAPGAIFELSARLTRAVGNFGTPAPQTDVWKRIFSDLAGKRLVTGFMTHAMVATTALARHSADGQPENLQRAKKQRTRVGVAAG